MSSPRRLHRPPATERPAGWRAVGVAAVAGRADREENAAMATAALAERVVHGVGARRAGPDWTARRIRGTTAGTGSVCRSSRRSRGSRMALRTLTPHLSPPRTLPERAAPRQRRGCGRCRSRGRKRARPPELAKPRRRGFAQRPQLHCCCWYFNLNELNDGPEDRQVSRFAQFYVTVDTQAWSESSYPEESAGQRALNTPVRQVRLFLGAVDRFRGGRCGVRRGHEDGGRRRLTAPGQLSLVATASSSCRTSQSVLWPSQVLMLV